MKKQEILAAFKGIDTDALPGCKKDKEMAKLFLQGMTYKEIAIQYGLTASRIRQTLSRQAHRAYIYKELLYDQKYQELIGIYERKIKIKEPIVIGCEVQAKAKHMMAISEAYRRWENRSC